MSSSIRQGEFYPVWPILDGKNIQYQWGEQRRNTAESKAIVRGSFQDIEDGADSLNALRALIGIAFGYQGFDNKYRLIYNKITEEFCAQKNDGTEAVPIWEDVWCIRFSDGQFQVTSEGGIQSNAGFYGPLPHDLLTIGEIGTGGNIGGTQFTLPNELFFNTDHGFYLTSVTSGPRAGKPIVNFAFPFGRSKTFPKNGRVWQVDHNFNTSPVFVQVMNDGDVVVIPDKVDVSNPNTAWFYFNEVTSGNALIATGGTGAAELLPSLTVTDGDSTFNAVSDLNFNKDRFYLSTDLEGSPVVNLSENYIPEDGSREFTGSVSVNTGIGDDALLTLDSGPNRVSGVRLDQDGTEIWRVDSIAGNELEIGVGGSNAKVISFEAGAGSSIGAIRVNTDNQVGIGLSTVEDDFHVGGAATVDDRLKAEAFYVAAGGDWSADQLTVTQGGITVRAGGVRVLDEVVAEAFYLEPGSGGGLWKSSNSVVLGSSDGHIELDVSAKWLAGNLGGDVLHIHPPDFATTSTFTTNRMISITPTITVESILYVFSGMYVNGTFIQAASPVLAAFTLFQSQALLKTTGANQPMPAACVSDGTRIQVDGSGALASAVASVFTIDAKPVLEATTSGDSISVTNWAGVRVQPQYNAQTGTTINFGALRGLWMRSPTVTTSPSGGNNGTKNASTYIGLDVDDISGSITVSSRAAAVRSAITAASTSRFLENTGGARSEDSGAFAWISGGQPKVEQDNVGLVLGAGDDVEIYWDSTRLVFDPDVGPTMSFEFDGTDNRVIIDTVPDVFVQGGVIAQRRIAVGGTSTLSITGNTNDYAIPTGTLARPLHRISTTGNHTVTGIVAPSPLYNRIIYIINVGSNDLILANLDAGSASSNQIITGTGASVTISASQTATLIYDVSNTKWRILN